MKTDNPTFAICLPFSRDSWDYITACGPTPSPASMYMMGFDYGRCEDADLFGLEGVDMLDDCRPDTLITDCNIVDMDAVENGIGYIPFNWTEARLFGFCTYDGGDLEHPGVLMQGNTCLVAPRYLRPARAYETEDLIRSATGIVYVVRREWVTAMKAQVIKTDSRFMAPGGNAFQVDHISTGTRIPSLPGLMIMTGMTRKSSNGGRVTRIHLVDEETGERITVELTRQA